MLQIDEEIICVYIRSYEDIPKHMSLNKHALDDGYGEHASLSKNLKDIRKMMDHIQREEER